MRYSKDPRTDRSLRHSVRDAMAYAVMAGGAETYLSAFALFLKASAQQVAVISTLPALLGSLAQLLSAWLGVWLGRRGAWRRRIILFGAALQGLMWLPLLALPLLFPEHAVPLLLICITLYFAGAHLAAPQWTSLMGDLVPERRRGRFFARRTRLTSATSFGALALGGLALHLFDERGHTAAGFAALFLVAFLARMVSLYYLWRMHDPGQGPGQPPVPHRSARAWLRAAKASGALWFSLYFVLIQLAVGISAPFFSVYMLRDLQFSYLEFMANTGTAVLVQFLALQTWGRISDAFGNRLILAVTSLTLPFLPSLWALGNNFWYLLAVQCLSGVTWAGLSLSAGNLLYDLVPAAQRATYSAAHNVLAAGGVFVGGMIGAALLPFLPVWASLFGDPAFTSGLLSLFIVSTLVRLTVVGLLLRRVRELRRPRRELSTRTFVLRVTRFNAFIGLVYELVGGLRRRTRRRRRLDLR